MALEALRGLHILAAAAAAVLAPAACAGAADVYRWVDGSGAVHFSDHPPADRPASKLDTAKSAGVDPVVEERRAKERRLLEVIEDERRQEAQAKATAEEQRRERAGHCSEARRRATLLEQNRVFYREDAKTGERVYLSAKEVDEANAEVRQAITQWCDDVR